MKVLVCGGRDYTDRKRVAEVLDDIHTTPITDLCHGAARGADSLAGAWAKQHREVKLHVYPADWNTYGKSAGPIRNQRMLDEFEPDVVVAFPGGRGTAHMVRIARTAGVRIVEVSE